MTTVLMNNVTMYTVQTINVGQLNTFQLYLNDSTGYTSARVTQRLDANREHNVHVNWYCLY